MEPTLGGIYLEDIKAPECFYIEKKLKERMSIPVFHDDQHGTAIISAAGMLNALKVIGKKIADVKVVCSGAGAAAISCLDLWCDLGIQKKNVTVCDSKGVIWVGRDAKMDDTKARYAQNTAFRTLADAMVGADVFLGLSTAGVLKPEMVKTMADKPIIFALSNPTSQAECTAEQAIAWSDGRAIVATGSPFDPVTHGGARHRIGQCNNAFIFPGVGLGVCVAKARHVSDGMFLDAARALASKVTEADIAESAVFPQLDTIRDCSHAVACAVIRRAVAEGHADAEVLEDLEHVVREAMWFPEYLPIHHEPAGVPEHAHA